MEAPVVLPLTAAERIDSHLARDEGGRLLVENVPAGELAERYGTPLHVVSETRLRENYRRIRDAFGSRWPAGVDVYFANKSNPALGVRRILAQEGAGGDCNGLHELQAALIGGTPAGRLVLNGNNKQDEAIRVAVSVGAHINVDDLDEIERIAETARALGRRARVGLRVKPELEAFGDRRSDFMDVTVRRYRELTKWGLEPAAAETAIRQIQGIPELHLTTLHYHLGRHFAEPAMFALVAPGLGALLGDLRDRTGWMPSFLAVGGGFTQGRDPFFRRPAPGQPWPTASDCFVEPIESYAEQFCEALAAELGARALPQPTLRLEPGRYIAASAGVTLTRVGTVKRGSSRTWVMVDTCVTQIGMSRSPRDAHAVVVADGGAEGDEIVCDVVGPLCVPDIIVEQGLLPTVARGTLLAILDTGGYADGEASNANAVGRPAVALVNGSDAELIRRPETFGDVFGRDSIPPRLIGGDPDTVSHDDE
jgi:diaminopimelate decarboxylase